MRKLLFVALVVLAATASDASAHNFARGRSLFVAPRQQTVVIQQQRGFFFPRQQTTVIRQQGFQQPFQQQRVTEVRTPFFNFLSVR